MTIEIISLGAGVQSSTMALMAARGLITPMPVAAVFADTHREPKSVYTWLDWLEKQLPYPVYRVQQGDLQASELRIRTSKKSGNLYRSGMIPAFTVTKLGKRGILPRRCTRDFKIRPVMRKVKELAGVPRRNRVGVYAKQWIGISMDEVIRMKPSREAWTESRWPLIELKMTRRDCLTWMKEHGYPEPPRSACSFCPYHSDDEWIRLRDREPEDFAAAVTFERDLQEANLKVKQAKGHPFLHDSRKPLSEVVFVPGKKGHFGNECEGMCGN